MIIIEVIMKWLDAWWNHLSANSFEHYVFGTVLNFMGLQTEISAS